MILTSENLDKLDDMAEMLKDLKINDVKYHVSNSENVNDAKGNPVSDPKTVTHTGDGKKKKVTVSSNGILWQKCLGNRNLPVAPPMMDTRIDNRFSTCGGDSHTLLMPATKEFIADAACGSAQVN